MQTDFDLDVLQKYQSSQRAPDGFDEFWDATLEMSREAARETVVTPVETRVVTLDTYDITFSGYAGQPVRAWFRRPRNCEATLPLVVQFVGYGGGRGLLAENLLWASSGFAHLVMDTRGQGSVWAKGDTPDPVGSDPQAPGFMTRGIGSPNTYYYRRVIADAVRAVEVGRSLPLVDSSQTFLVGASQGGGIALAASVLAPRVSAVIPQVPFLCDLPRALRIHDNGPYAEVVQYLAVHRDKTVIAEETLRYFDGVNFARRSTAPAYFTVGLMDDICKPSTVFGAYNAYAGPKTIEIFPFNGHEGGGAGSDSEAVRILRSMVVIPS